MTSLEGDDVAKHFILRRIDSIETLRWARVIWKNENSVADNIGSDATRLICEAYEKNPAFFGNRSKKWILGGLFYLLGKKYKEPKTQKQIAHILDSNEMTIRDSYQNWMHLLKVLKIC